MRTTHWLAKCFVICLPLLGLLAVVVWLDGCFFFNYPKVSDSKSVSSLSQVRVVQHFMGKTIVPAYPQRVVVLGGRCLENALALGIKPIAASKLFVSQLQRLVGPLSGIEDVDWLSPSIEKVLFLKPDLILGMHFHQDIYPLLSHIAPTVLAPPGASGAWKESFAFTARVLGKTKTAQQVMDNYYARLTQFKAKMGDRLNTTLVSVAELRTDALWLWAKASFSGVILKDAGIARPDSQTLDSQATLSLGGGPAAYALSEELMSELDGDILFLVSEDALGKRDLYPILKQLKAKPLWSKLKVVQQEKVHEVGFYWVQFGPLAANRMIDDLEQYLVKQQ
ncbi:iron-siderophore ABC transporter substrate-binding protein [Nostocaceae cyanobacterium CENA369]|uniref:Iron-siderophore ABC transporter substrate-binding protein n=1 Tax=Dendronalium phyllosphericum CENA369 TaxID=1725256 RepID=A0A8J7ID40_9NOST|nr:iron-siderophore ABC transporter substrate-binding protein [Dendronalium phyllosphericum]MBH8576590.1 iron-siderophore ABC transporter substrate-binding protein [Dendronalium phyllosphericum CENA369]